MPGVFKKEVRHGKRQDFYHALSYNIRSKVVVSDKDVYTLLRSYLQTVREELCTTGVVEIPFLGIIRIRITPGGICKWYYVEQ